jgi:hypothetical protein
MYVCICLREGKSDDMNNWKYLKSRNLKSV